nr:bifunctional bis(5'-adenosyl)-triphosphatase/adenylylsulfatase FHIT [Tanacetum cinerariifolium]
MKLLQQLLSPLSSFRSFTIATTRFRSSFHSKAQMEGGGYKFGPYKIDDKEVFYSTELSYALVNLRPLLPGHILDLLDKRTHVLVCPRREVKRFVDLTPEETSDLWISAQKIGKLLENYHKASSLTLAIQDGPQAGQTVPHVHIHIVPRKGGDFENNDEIYDALDEKEKELKKTLDLDKERKDRSMEEMAREADEYRKLFS